MTTSATADQQRAAEAALRAWPIKAISVEPVSISENVAFRVRDETDRSFVLRLHRPGYHNLEELNAERAWTAALTAAGVDVPVALPTRDGAWYVNVPVGDERRFAGLLEWVDGETLAARIQDGREPDVPGCFARLGTVMASLHQQAATWQPPAGFRRHALDADGLMGETPFWGRFWESPHLDADQQRTLSDLRGHLYDRLRSFGTGRQTFSMIHADLHPANLIVDGDRVHVIDFDDAGFGWHAYDLAVALFYIRREDNYRAVRDALVAGYRRVRPLHEETVDRIPLFYLIRNLASIGWVAARPELTGNAERTAWLMANVDWAVDDVLR